MRRTLQTVRFPLVLIVAGGVCLLAMSAAWAQHGIGVGTLDSYRFETWTDDIWRQLLTYQETYPMANFEPYQVQIKKAAEAIGRREPQVVKTEMEQFLQMLRSRAHGIDKEAADDLLKFALTVTPLKKYEIKAP